MKRVFLGIFAVGAVAVGVVLWHVWSRQVPAAAEPLLKNASLRVVSGVGYIVRPSNATYEEALTQLRTHVAELENIKLELQQLETTRNSKRLLVALEYVEASQRVLRGEQQLLRQRIVMDAAVEASRRSYGNGESAARSDAAASLALAEYEVARKSFGDAVGRYVQAHSDAANVLDAGVLATKDAVEGSLAVLAEEDRPSRKDADEARRAKLERLDEHRSGSSAKGAEVICSGVTVDLQNGTLAGLGPAASMGDVATKLPCFSAQDQEGSDYNYGGGVYFPRYGYNFYTFIDTIHIMPGFMGKFEPDVRFMRPPGVEKVLGPPERKEISGGQLRLQFRRQEACLILSFEPEGGTRLADQVLSEIDIIGRACAAGLSLSALE